jgi:parallel beta-helix repeat protein
VNRIDLNPERTRGQRTIAVTTRRLRPTVTALEGRTLLSTIVVNNPTDTPITGQTDLRQAITQANHDEGGDTIVFSSLFNTPQTIDIFRGPLVLTDTAKTTIAGPGADLLTLSGPGGDRVFELTAGSVAALSGLTITDGGANDEGAGVLNDGGNLTLTNVIVRGNSAESSDNATVGAGLAAVGTGATTTLSDCTITGNAVGGGGGGIYNAEYDTLTMTDCTISNNSAGGGGGLFNDGTATLTNCIFNGNSATGYGGGLFSSGMLALAGCTISGNSANRSAGGLAAYYGGAITLTGCTVSANSTSGDGGGAATVSGQAPGGGTIAFSNCTISGNSAGGAGGGCEDDLGTMSLANCTVSGNTAYGGYGGIDVFSGPSTPTGPAAAAKGATLTLTNTIVAGNVGGDVGNSYTGSDNLIGGNPMLSALGNFGGPTETMALLPGSPAIDGGTSTGAPAFDQRGEPRAGHVDIGAFQSQGFTLTCVAGIAWSAPVNQPFPKPLEVTVAANNPIEPVNGGIVNFIVSAVRGASATLSAPTATIAGGVASVTATANGTIGKYFFSATAVGARPDGVPLINTERPSLVVTTTLDSMNNTDGLTSLREAIAYADSLPGPHTVTFDPAVFGSKRRTIRLVGGPLVLADPATTTIVGPGAKLLTIGGRGKSQAFDVEGGSLALSGVTIANGNADLGGGLRNEGGRLALTNVAIRGNRAIVGGGLFNDGRTSMSRVFIMGNRAHVGCGLFNTRAATLLWRR